MTLSSDMEPLMDNLEKQIGRLILSSAFGVGKIVSIDKMGQNRDFFVIECIGNNVTTFVPVNDNLSYRFVSSESEIEQYLNQLTEDITPLEFESKKERINFFKDQSKIQDTERMSFLINQLSSLSDRGSTEDNVMNKLIDSFSLEYSLITNKTQEECKDLVLDRIKGAKNE